MIKLFDAFRNKPVEIKEVDFPRGQIVLNKTNFFELMKQRRWRNNVDVGKALGYTRQNIAYIMAGSPVSAEFIARIAILTGTSFDKSYSYYFDVIVVGQPDNHQKWNQAKADGRMPYEAHSISAEHRSQDAPVEKRQYKLF
jgi:hypothetical protein